jgi:hypothetical protein
LSRRGEGIGHDLSDDLFNGTGRGEEHVRVDSRQDESRPGSWIDQARPFAPGFSDRLDPLIDSPRTLAMPKLCFEGASAPWSLAYAPSARRRTTVGPVKWISDRPRCRRGPRLATIQCDFFLDLSHKKSEKVADRIRDLPHSAAAGTEPATQKPREFSRRGGAAASRTAPRKGPGYRQQAAVARGLAQRQATGLGGV